MRDEEGLAVHRVTLVEEVVDPPEHKDISVVGNRVKNL